MQDEHRDFTGSRNSPGGSGLFTPYTLEQHIINCCNYVFMVEPWERLQMKMLTDECVLCWRVRIDLGIFCPLVPSVSVHRFINFLPLLN
jgi:hypothetical protein